MPLPAALLAKLSKRGIVTPTKSASKLAKKEDFKGYIYCPNKNNIFHICTSWCETNWKGQFNPNPTYARNVQKLLFKYPLPNNWTEVFDKSVGRYYYWNIENDLVSWLPPKHPKANISKSAAKLREEKSRKADIRDKETEDKAQDDREFKKPYSRSSKRENDRDRDRDDKYRKDDKYANKRQRKEHNNLDPMDPASYSDIEPGTWSDGLENNKTHADNTASGVLYQQRPYPSPSEVLASNKEKQKKH